MGIKWKKDELAFIKECYESGKSLHVVFEEFDKLFGNRTENAVWLAIKRNKFKHTKEHTSSLKSLATKGKNNPMYGKAPWSKGLTKETNSSLKNTSEKVSAARKQMHINGLINICGENNPMYGKDPWNKGETKATNEIVNRISKKISACRKATWENYSQDQRDEIIGKLTAGANKKKNNTSIELIVKRALEELNINFSQQYRESRFVFDFYLTDYNFVLECQGDYWHANPIKNYKLNDVQIKNIERDKKKILYLENKNISHLFLWETDIHKDFEKLKDRILNSLN